MFIKSFEKVAGPLRLSSPHARIDPVTVRDTLGASKKLPFPSPISRFASGHKPRAALKPLTSAGSFGKKVV
jgi:hypothetical protein